MEPRQNRHKRIIRVIIHNFQKHKNKVVEFDDFTAITGRTNHGKTSIFRAIEWCLYNKTASQNFITYGETQCSVTIIFDNGTEITRTKNTSGSINSYDVIVNGEAIHLEGFGIGVPKEVAIASGMRVVDLFGDKQMPNLCEQLSAPFFIGEKPINRGLLIGKMGNLDSVDLAIKNAGTDLRAAKSKRKDYKASLKEVNSELSELTGLTLATKKLNAVEGEIDKCQYLEEKLKNIINIIQSIKQLEEKKQTMSNILLNKEDLLKTIDLLDEAIELNVKLTQIKNIYIKLRESREKLKDLSDTLSRINKKDLDDCISEVDSAINISKDIASINSVIKKYNKSREQLNDLKKLPSKESVEETISILDNISSDFDKMSKIKAINANLKNALKRKEKGEQVISELQDDLENKIDECGNMLKDLKVCPVCESKITIDQIENVKKQL